MRMWEWREDAIQLVGATQETPLRIRYEKSLLAIVLGTDPMQIRSSIDLLAYAVAAMAARSRGVQALAADMFALAENAAAELIER